MQATDNQEFVTYDVVVVGGGAGLGGALMLGRFRRSVLVIDAASRATRPPPGFTGSLPGTA